MAGRLCPSPVLRPGLPVLRFCGRGGSGRCHGKVRGGRSNGDPTRGTLASPVCGLRRGRDAQPGRTGFARGVARGTCRSFRDREGGGGLLRGQSGRLDSRPLRPNRRTRFRADLIWVTKLRLGSSHVTGPASSSGADIGGGGHSKEQRVSIDQPRPDLWHPIMCPAMP
jgi:hypothetical protein